jgi:hypothetical protein
VEEYEALGWETECKKRVVGYNIQYRVILSWVVEPTLPTENFAYSCYSVKHKRHQHCSTQRREIRHKHVSCPNFAFSSRLRSRGWVFSNSSSLYLERSSTCSLSLLLLRIWPSATKDWYKSVQRIESDEQIIPCRKSAVRLRILECMYAFYAIC